MPNLTVIEAARDRLPRGDGRSSPLRAYVSGSRATRGQVLKTARGAKAVATHHPSAMLRAPDPTERRYAQELAADFSIAASLLGQND